MATRKGRVALLVAGGLVLGGQATAVDIGVSALKFISIDKGAAAGKSKTVFVSKDAGATLSGDNDVTAISVDLMAQYNGAAVRAEFNVPAGATNGTDGWLVVKDTVAKYVNKGAPGGPTGAKIAVIKPATLLKLIGKTRGDASVMNLIEGGPPMDSVYTAYRVTETSATNTHCSEFPLGSCAFKAIGGGTGRKLVCKGGAPDAACNAVVPSATTSTSTTSTTLIAGCYIDTGLTVIDTCNALEWEKKQTSVGSGTNAGNPHDVDNVYSWAGRCTGSAVLCQPSPDAAATCAWQTNGAPGCTECGAGEGSCDVDSALNSAITTVWEWVSQLNAAGFAGHRTWRLATSAGSVGEPTGQPPEIESIVDLGAPGCGSGGPCIHSVFGPTNAGNNWAASSDNGGLIPEAWTLLFITGRPQLVGKAGGRWVRAVRNHCVATSGTICDLGDGTVYDSATDLMWEKKDTTVNSGVDGSNLHDVDNRYSWAGWCTVSAAYCQPDAAAAATCTAQTGGALGCTECGGGEGTCDVDPVGFGALTTIWDWVNQLNATRFAGHTDWRLATSAGSVGSPTGEAPEIESIVDLGAPGCGGGISPCIDTIFGPTVVYQYWSASTVLSFGSSAWYVSFDDGQVTNFFKEFDLSVRAVRSGS